MGKPSLRYAEPEDLPYLTDAERAANAYEDEDFGVTLYREWAWREEDFVEFVHRRNTLVVACDLPLGGKSLWTCGGFGYELAPGSLEVEFVCLHPAAPPECWEAVATHLKKKADGSRRRGLVRLYLRDRDEAGLRTLLPFWAGQGFSFRLAPDWFGDHDGWEGTYGALPRGEGDC